MDIEGSLAIIGIFFLPIVLVITIVAIVFNNKNNRNQLQADLATKALEAGQPIPEKLFAEPTKKRNPLNTGIICMGVGVGISLFFVVISLTSDPHALAGASVGLIPFFIGIAYLLIHFLEKKHQKPE
ncbi:hypothetical protein FACS1894162_2620 [Bacteroidia bacterium]|nr:hypothetical protein FACS1894162_2620 [Bacteroidia bacterium]